MVGMRGLYGWKLDPGAHDVTAPLRREGTTNPELLKRKQTPAVYFLLDALKRYDKMPVDQIREIVLEIGRLGRDGLDYASPDQKYTLKSPPGEKFSGPNLMCLMFAGFKRIAPEHDLQMDLHEPFLVALEISSKPAKTLNSGMIRTETRANSNLCRGTKDLFSRWRVADDNIKQCGYLNSRFCSPTKYKWTVTDAVW